MKVTYEKPEIMRFVYRQEKTDPDYGSCLWAIFDFDLRRGLLNIQSDCGNYSYRWPERGKQFIRLFFDMDESYLLNKLCGKPREFDLEGTLADIETYLSEMDIDEKQALIALERLRDILEDYILEDSPEVAEYIIDEWNNDCEVGIDQAWELVKRKYSADQKRIANILINIIAPAMRGR